MNLCIHGCSPNKLQKQTPFCFNKVSVSEMLVTSRQEPSMKPCAHHGWCEPQVVSSGSALPSQLKTSSQLGGGLPCLPRAHDSAHPGKRAQPQVLRGLWAESGRPVGTPALCKPSTRGCQLQSQGHESNEPNFQSLPGKKGRLQWMQCCVNKASGSKLSL